MERVLGFDLERLNDPVTRQRALVVASVMFIAGCVWSVRNFPGEIETLQVTPLLVQIGFAIPLTICANALEFWMLSRLAGGSTSYKLALEVSTLGSAANLLPIPGAFLVRVAQLRSQGIGFKMGTSVNFSVGLMWVGVACGYSAGWLAYLGRPLLSAGIGVASIVSLITAIVLCWSLESGRQWLGWIFLNKAGIVLLESFRVYLCFQVLSVSVTYAQSSVLVVGSVVGSAVSLVPAGLGIREVVSAALAPAIGLAAAAGFLAAALGRVLEVAVLIPVTLLLSRTPKVRSA
jgi:hypothetical protein